MKIRSLFLTAVISSLILSFVCAAQVKPPVEIPKATKAINIDGNLEEYQNLKPSIKMDNESYEKLGYNPWDGIEDLSADIYLLWDDENLYVAAKVVDDVPFLNNQEANEIWDGDCFEVVLGMDETADPERPIYGKGDYQIGLSPGNNKDIKPSEWVWHRDDYAGGIVVASMSAEGGYAIEAKIPFQVLGGFKPEPGKKLDLDVAIDDADKNKREIQFVWSGSKNFYMSPSEWGRAVLTAKQPVLKPARNVLFTTSILIGIIIVALLIIKQFS